MPRQSRLERFGFRLIVDVIPEGLEERPVGYTAVVYRLPLPEEDERLLSEDAAMVASTIAPGIEAAIGAAGGAVTRFDPLAVPMPTED